MLPQCLLSSLLDRAKIGLNLTLSARNETPDGVDPRFASCLRITEMLDRNICVVSEEIPLDNPYADYMVTTPLERLASTCKELLDSGRWREAGRSSAAAFRRKMDVTRVCGPVIERTLRAL